MAGILVVFGWAGVDDEMDPFDAVAHAFSTLPTGGFSSRARGFEEFAPASQWVAIVFMVLAGANFALMYLAFARGRFRPLLRDEEIRLYIGLLALGSTILALELLSENLYRGEEAARNAIFQTVSMMTTTGAANADFAEWSVLALVVIVGLMFFGGTAGSTSGSVKVVRHLLIGRILRRELAQTVHPELVAPIRLNRVVVEERTLRAVVAFVLIYVGIFAVGSLALVVESARADVTLTPFGAIAAAATTLGNVGPGVGFAGPMGSFEPFSDLSTAAMVLLMWLGRLELIPVVVLFTRSDWRV
jgi:trk system potassium uptake protein